eukprot:4236185-Prorocentrum_lima.AAC.1
MSRHALAATLAKHFPELKGLIGPLLARTHQAYWLDGSGQKHSLSMATGVHQGCPFSMGLFSIITGELADA